MFRLNKDGQLVEYSLKQREQWLLYSRERANSMPERRAPTPFAFIESRPRKILRKNSV